MRALKALVIVMGILILAGTTIVIATIFKRSQDMVEGTEADEAGNAGAAAPRAFAEGRVTLPEGAEVIEMLTGDERLILRLRLAGGGEQLVFIDMGSGEVIGTLSLERSR